MKLFQILFFVYVLAIVSCKDSDKLRPIDYSFDIEKLNVPKIFIYKYYTQDSTFNFYLKNELFEQQGESFVSIKSYTNSFIMDSVIYKIDNDNTIFKESYMFQFDSIINNHRAVKADSIFAEPIPLNSIKNYKLYFRYPLIKYDSLYLHFWINCQFDRRETIQYNNLPTECIVYKMETIQQLDGKNATLEMSSINRNILNEEMYSGKGIGVIKRIYNEKNYCVLDTIIDSN